MEEDIKSILQGNFTPIAKELIPDEKHMELLPITKKNICYICGSILFDDEGRVLLVQEAKQSCHGQWYLPAGRLEPGETIVAGAKREVKEEAGLECDLTTLVCLELNGIWVRFTFTGNITGGSLKTLAEKDAESLQAKFFHPDELPQDIRCNDILKLIKLVRIWREQQNHGLLLPVIHPQKYISYRFVIIDRAKSDAMHMLGRMLNGRSHIPVRFEVHASAKWMAHNVLKEAFSSKELASSFIIWGLLGVEHRGTGEVEDGLCTTLLVSINLIKDQPLPELKSTDYAWIPVTSSQLHTKFNEGVDKKIVPVFV